MMKFRLKNIVAFIAAGLVCSVGALAQQQPQILQRQSIAVDHHVIPGQAWRVELPKLSAKGSCLLELTVRKDSPSMGGYGRYMILSFNGQPLDAARSRYSSRLVNKALSFKLNKGGSEVWNSGDGLWETIFAPDFNTSFKTYSTEEKEPYRYLIDVSDLVREDGVNIVEIGNTWPLKPPGDVVVTMNWMAARLAAEVVVPQPRPGVTMLPALNVSNDGSFTIASSGEPVRVASSFSVPGGGRNAFGNTSRETVWRANVTRVDSHHWRIEAAGAHYSLTRDIRQTEGRIAVEDTFKNLTGQDIGIIFDNYLDLQSQPSIDYVRIGGMRGQGINNINSRENPTLFFPLTDSSLTMVAEDDVLRNQARFYFDTASRRSGIADEMFAMAPLSSYTVRWSLYIRPSDDYFDMINQVRRDWDANITIPGPVHFVNYRSFARMSQEVITQAVKKSGAKYFVFWEISTPGPVTAWGDNQVFAYGPGMYDPVFKEEIELVKEAVRKLHTADPEIKVALYTEPFFICPERPDDTTYRDSWVTGMDGHRVASHYDTKGRYPYRTVYPTLTNSYGKAYMKVIDFYLNELNLDWIYCDESNGPGVTIKKGDNLEGYLTYNAWDGHSAKIDPNTGRITQKCGFLSLLSDDFIHAMSEKVRAKGGFILFNGSGTTRHRQSNPSMSETQWDVTRGYRTHLGTPLAFAAEAYSGNMLDVCQRLDMGMLLFRSPWNKLATPVARFTPITPIEIHSGTIVGRERIITDKSGEYGWKEGPFVGTLYLYDAKGELHETREIQQRDTPVKINVPDNGVAVLVRNNP